jgi:quercetin dioxygenase-like cupin family protein
MNDNNNDDSCKIDEKSNEATRNRPAGDRVIDASSILIDLPAYIRQIKQEETWKKNDRNSITVFKTDQMRIVLGGLHEGAEMPAHKAEGIMNIQVLEGLLEINTDELTALLNTGQMVAVHKGCNYRVVALEESIYLLTISDVTP